MILKLSCRGVPSPAVDTYHFLHWRTKLVRNNLACLNSILSKGLTNATVFPDNKHTIHAFNQKELCYNSVNFDTPWWGYPHSRAHNTPWWTFVVVQLQSLLEVGNGENLWQWSRLRTSLRTFFGHNAQKMKFFIKDFFSKCDQIRIHFFV